MAESHFVFIKNDRVENTLVFATKDVALADQICLEQGYDKAVWIADKNVPARWSTYDGKTFTAPTEDYLISIGVLTVSAEEISQKV